MPADFPELVESFQQPVAYTSPANERRVEMPRDNAQANAIGIGNGPRQQGAGAGRGVRQFPSSNRTGTDWGQQRSRIGSSRSDLSDNWRGDRDPKVTLSFGSSFRNLSSSPSLMTTTGGAKRVSLAPSKSQARPCGNAKGRNSSSKPHGLLNGCLTRTTGRAASMDRATSPRETFPHILMLSTTHSLTRLLGNLLKSEEEPAVRTLLISPER